MVGAIKHGYTVVVDTFGMPVEEVLEGTIDEEACEGGERDTIQRT